MGMNKIIAVWCALFCATCFLSVNANQVQTVDNNKRSEQSMLSEIEIYVNGLKSLMASFSERTSRNNEKNKGHIYIKRASINGKTVVKINYESGELLSVSLSGRFLTITDRKKKKSRTYSILTTPLYSILAGKLDFKNFDYTLLENTPQRVTVQFFYEKQNFKLTFRKNKNKIDKLLFWNVSSDKGWAEITLDDKEYYENDLSKIPEEVFKKKD